MLCNKSTEYMAKRWKVICAYDGTDFCGWQIQPNGVTIQEVIEKRLQVVFKEPIRIHGSGRTDSGVHASGQVFHFDADWAHEKEKLLRAIQSTLPESILLKQITPVSDQFHARFSATGKRYMYRIYRGMASPETTRFQWSIGDSRSFDLELLHTALKALEGWHDFQAFAVNRGAAYETTWRCIREASCSENGNTLTFSFEGNGFLYKMVRGLTGALVAVASGQMSMEQFLELVDGTPRGARVVTAPSKGLSLEKVYYRKRNFPNPPSHVLNKLKTAHQDPSRGIA